MRSTWHLHYYLRILESNSSFYILWETLISFILAISWVTHLLKEWIRLGRDSLQMTWFSWIFIVMENHPNIFGMTHSWLYSFKFIWWMKICIKTTEIFGVIFVLELHDCWCCIHVQRVEKPIIPSRFLFFGQTIPYGQWILILTIARVNRILVSKSFQGVRTTFIFLVVHWSRLAANWFYILVFSNIDDTNLFFVKDDVQRRS